jgi:hypothetical protein
MDGSDRNHARLDASVDLYWWTCTCTRGALGRTDYAQTCASSMNTHQPCTGVRVDIRHGELMRYAALDGHPQGTDSD